MRCMLLASISGRPNDHYTWKYSKNCGIRSIRLGCVVQDFFCNAELHLKVGLIDTHFSDEIRLQIRNVIDESNGCFLVQVQRPR